MMVLFVQFNNATIAFVLLNGENKMRGEEKKELIIY